MAQVVVSQTLTASSQSPAANRLPSADQTDVTIGFLPYSSVRSSLPSIAQILMTPHTPRSGVRSQPVVASRAPSRLHATVAMPRLTPSSLRTSEPVTTSQTRAVLSVEPAARRGRLVEAQRRLGRGGGGQIEAEGRVDGLGRGLGGCRRSGERGKRQRGRRDARDSRHRDSSGAGTGDSSRNRR